MDLVKDGAVEPVKKYGIYATIVIAALGANHIQDEQLKDAVANETEQRILFVRDSLEQVATGMPTKEITSRV